MFDTSYEFDYKNHKIIKNGEFMFKEHKLTFRCKHGLQYIVNVEEYIISNHPLFVIKFHLKSHSDSTKKYNLLTGKFDAPSLIRTCVNIMIDFYEGDNMASFGFIGANTEGEKREETKRFRIYRKVMENFFSPLKFEHKVYQKESAYILLNRAATTQTPHFLLAIETLFKINYNFET